MDTILVEVDGIFRHRKGPLFNLFPVDGIAASFAGVEHEHCDRNARAGSGHVRWDDNSRPFCAHEERVDHPGLNKK